MTPTPSARAEAERAPSEIALSRDGTEATVRVIVSGPVGCGKSAICGEIEIALKAVGVPVEWRDSLSEKRLTHADWQHYLDMYKPSVVIVETLTNGRTDRDITDAKAFIAEHKTFGWEQLSWALAAARRIDR